MQPQIYLAQTPATAHARRLIRARALELRVRLGQMSDAGPCVAVLNIVLKNGDLTDVVLLRPASVIVGIITESDIPIDIHADGRWIVRATGTPIQNAQGDSPRTQIINAREHVRRFILDSDPTLEEALGRIVAALIVAPTTHPESSAVFDIEDHRQQIKLLGLDELAPLASMLRAGATLDEALMRRIAAILDARRWHDGEQFLFEIGTAPYILQLLDDQGQPLHSFTLLEGANVIGRRTQPIQHEYRLKLDDDTVSADHAVLVCAADGRVTLRDTSTNGSVVRPPNGPEQRLHHTELAVPLGSIIRLGETSLQLEAAPPQRERATTTN